MDKAARPTAATPKICVDNVDALPWLICVAAGLLGIEFKPLLEVKLKLLLGVETEPPLEIEAEPLLEVEVELLPVVEAAAIPAPVVTTVEVSTGVE